MAMEPRYIKLTKTLLGEISSGAYPVGSLLPTELELAEKYKVGRGTVRSALGQIEMMGLISRRKRAGTRVESTTPRSTEYTPAISTIEELVQYGANAERVIQSIRNIVVDVKMSKRLGCSPGTHWMEIQTARMNPVASIYPVAWSYVYVQAADGARIRRQLKNSRSLICDLLCDATGSVVKEIRQTVRAVGVPVELAQKLGTQANAHALEFLRKYYDQSDNLIEVTLSVQPGDRFGYTTVLRRKSARPEKGAGL